MPDKFKREIMSEKTLEEGRAIVAELMQNAQKDVSLLDELLNLLERNQTLIDHIVNEYNNDAVQFRTEIESLQSQLEKSRSENNALTAIYKPFYLAVRNEVGKVETEAAKRKASNKNPLTN